MSSGQRLLKLKKDVSQERSKDTFTRWSARIRSEAVTLARQYSVKVVSKETSLPEQTIFYWLRNTPMNEGTNQDSIVPTEENIAITRFSLSKREAAPTKEELRPLAALFKDGGIELKIFCPLLCEKIVAGVIS